MCFTQQFAEHHPTQFSKKLVTQISPSSIDRKNHSHKLISSPHMNKALASCQATQISEQPSPSTGSSNTHHKSIDRRSIYWMPLELNEFDFLYVATCRLKLQLSDSHAPCFRHQHTHVPYAPNDNRWCHMSCFAGATSAPAQSVAMSIEPSMSTLHNQQPHAPTWATLAPCQHNCYHVNPDWSSPTPLLFTVDHCFVVVRRRTPTLIGHPTIKFSGQNTFLLRFSCRFWF